MKNKTQESKKRKNSAKPKIPNNRLQVEEEEGTGDVMSGFYNRIIVVEKCNKSSPPKLEFEH